MPSIRVPITKEALRQLKELSKKRGIPIDMLAQEAIKRYLGDEVE